MKNSSANPDPTIPISLDYFFELSDDEKQLGKPEGEVILIPPVPPAVDGSAAPSSEPKQKPQS